MCIGNAQCTTSFLQDPNDDDGQIANEKQIISYFHFNYFKIQFKSSVSLFYSTYFTAAAVHPIPSSSSRASHSFPIDSLMFKSCTCSIKHGDKWEFMWKLCQWPKRGEVRMRRTLPSTQLHNNFIIFLCSNSTRLESKIYCLRLSLLLPQPQFTLIGF